MEGVWEVCLGRMVDAMKMVVYISPRKKCQEIHNNKRGWKREGTFFLSFFIPVSSSFIIWQAVNRSACLLHRV